ncbi:hypothetical protein [Calidithermus roseus]|uniref:Lipoprotein n=1 Tax=Calidithermus roseus TaxID=1644118 RepID=A0A399EIG4_9DEIN|nr:hypothetical protein [Calidithermus roseus]RIH84514.1 hypothetical protein Mrose_02616 [Calidithermus roseus]
MNAYFRPLLLAGIAALLGACSALPITIDLLPHLGNQKSGSYTQEVPPGQVTLSNAILPEGGWNADFSSQNIPVSFKTVRLSYEVAVSSSGVALSGSVRAQAYLAPMSESNPIQEKYKLGAEQSVDLGASSSKLAGSAELTPEQVTAVNEKKVKVLVVLNGTASSGSGGTLKLDYEVQKLLLTFTVI